MEYLEFFWRLPDQSTIAIEHVQDQLQAHQATPGLGPCHQRNTCV